jgi:hypothetical protein
LAEVPDIEINSIEIPDIQSRIVNYPILTAPEIPVSIPLGFPVIEMPCVETRRSDYENDALITNDREGNVVLCPAGVPAFTPLNYTPEEFVYTKSEEPQRYEEPETPASDEPPPSTPKSTDCPPPDAPEIGTKVPDGKGTKEIISYQLIGNRCVTQYSEVSFTEQIVDAIPSVPQVITTGTIAVVATASAAATPFLLRVVKPLVKQVLTRVQKAMGKKVTSPNLSQRRTNAYREKRNLPPLKW